MIDRQMGSSERLLVTVAVMLAVLIQVLDTTIANVALPHMQASLGATQESINWVLTSYIVASAIGSIPEVLDGTGAAALVPAGDSSALAGALQNLIDDAEARRRMGAAARAEALTHHSWTSRCQEILAPFVLESV